MPTSAGNFDMRQTAAPLDFLSRFQPNQRMLVRSLYQAAAAQRQITKPVSVQFYVNRQITLRCFRSLGEHEGECYAHSIGILRDHADEARAYAESVLRAAGKAPVPVKTGGRA